MTSAPTGVTQPVDVTSTSTAPTTMVPPTPVTMSKNHEGRKYTSQQLKPNKCANTLSDKQSAKLWEKERDACLDKEFANGIGYGALLRLQYVGRTVLCVPYTLLMASCCFSASAVSLAGSGCCCATALFRATVCCDCKNNKNLNMGCAAGAVSGTTAAIGGLLLGSALYQGVTAPVHVIAPEALSALGEYEMALALEQFNDRLQENLKNRRAQIG